MLFTVASSDNIALVVPVSTLSSKIVFSVVVSAWSFKGASLEAVFSSIISVRSVSVVDLSVTASLLVLVSCVVKPPVSTSPAIGLGTLVPKYIVARVWAVGCGGRAEGGDVLFTGCAGEFAKLK